MKIKESNNSNIIFDVDVSSLQPLITLGNKLNTDYIDFNGMDLTTYLGFLQPSLANYGDGTNAQILSGNYYVKGLIVGGNVNNIYTISDGTKHLTRDLLNLMLILPHCNH